MATITLLQKLSNQLTQSQPNQPAAGKAAAEKIIEEYFNCYSPCLATDQLWLLTVGTISNDNLEEQTGSDRHNYISFFEFSKLLIKAVYHLHSLQAPPGAPNAG